MKGIHVSSKCNSNRGHYSLPSTTQNRGLVRHLRVAQRLALPVVVGNGIDIVVVAATVVIVMAAA